MNPKLTLSFSTTFADYFSPQAKAKPTEIPPKQSTALVKS